MHKYSISQFCRITGTTKRTLHYYDQINLLKPKKQANGYRQYTENDFLTLQQILTLRYLGSSIANIKKILQSSRSSPNEILEKQAATLKSKARVMNKVAGLIEDATFLNKETQKMDWSLILQAMHGLQKDNQEEWFKHFYTENEFSDLQRIWSEFSEEKVAHYIKITAILILCHPLKKKDITI
jgi:DNA-binding transcriptional MerR regulator